MSSKNQVVIPEEARKKLGVGPGARLLVLVKEDRIAFMPEPRHFVRHSSGRHPPTIFPTRPSSRPTPV